MLIHPFLAGALAVILAELLAFAALIAVVAYKQGKKK